MYQEKYLKYQKKIDKILNCEFKDFDRYLLGSGGSSSIVFITKDNRVYKLFTLFDFIDEIDHESMLKDFNTKVENEISIIKDITKNIIEKNISLHYVRFINETTCNNSKVLFNFCGNYIDYLRTTNKDTLCNIYYSNYNKKNLQDTYKKIEIEYCNYSCKEFLIDISVLPFSEVETYLDIFFFQIIYTLMRTKDIYPYFTHNDLFIRNILGFKEKNNGNYYTYKYNNKSYYVPAKLFFPKINDFGYTNLSEDVYNVRLYKSEYKDIYNLMLDVYNGSQLDSVSLTSLWKNNPEKLIQLKKYFNKFFNTDVLDEYMEVSKNNIDWSWNNILDNDFVASLEPFFLKNPSELLENYFYDLFGKINSNIETFG